MKRIAILTLYYKNSNYGGVLQAYALQKFLQNQGYDSKQISYDLESGYEGYFLKKLIKNFKTLIKILIRQEWYTRHKSYEKKIYKFAEMIPHTRKLKANNISKISNDFDAFIVGSDQVWNPIGWQKVLFFSFLPKDKFCMSYAASIARDSLSKEEISFIKDNIDHFSYISIREKDMINTLSKWIPNKTFDVMPDPTFLLDSSQWRKLINNRLITSKYIFAYFLGTEKKHRQDAILYAIKHGLKIVFIPYMNKQMYEWDKKHMEYMMENVGVNEFLSLIFFAECVITDSFHGVVFSLKYNKPFYVLPRFTNNDKNSMNSRISMIVEEFGMGDRFINSLNFDESYELTMSEEKRIETNMERLRKKGKDYLEKALGCLNYE